MSFIKEAKCSEKYLVKDEGKWDSLGYFIMNFNKRYSYSTVRIIQKRWLWQAGMEMRNAYRILVGVFTGEKNIRCDTAGVLLFYKHAHVYMCVCTCVYYYKN